MDVGSVCSYSFRECKRRRCFLPCRHIVAILGFYSYFVLGSQRMNISIAIVAMVNRNASDRHPVTGNTNFTDENLHDGNSATEHLKEANGEFNWGPELENYVLAASFAGFMLSLTPGGLLADAWNAKALLGLGVLSSSVCNLLSPVGCRWSVYCLIMLQFIKGLGQGVIQPALGRLSANWFPKEELAWLSAVVYSGGRAGNFVAGLVSGLLCEVNFLGGWPLVFYVFGIIGCCCNILVYFYLYETPACHPSIGISELIYINNNLKRFSTTRQSTPWIAMLRSPATWALFISMFGVYWFPMYFVSVHSVFLGSILNIPMAEIGIITSCPYILQSVVTLIAGAVSDWVFRKKYASINVVRKVNNLAYTLIVSLCMIGAFVADYDKWANVVLFTVAMAGSGFSNPGCYVVPMDMTPAFAGTLTGIGTTAGFLSATIVPILTGMFLKNEQTLLQWKKFFLVTAFITLFSGLIFLFFGSANLQPWNSPAPKYERNSIRSVSENVHSDGNDHHNVPEKFCSTEILYRTRM